MQGGCACGRVRYELSSEPYDAGWCHCRTCQRVSAAPALAFATVPLTDFVVTGGEDSLAIYRSTPFGERRFCILCSTAITIHVTHQADEIDIAITTFDDPDSVTPGFHIYTEEAITWAPIDDGLPRYPRLRPDTRGLSAGATEA